MHAIGRRFEPVHLHIALALILLWGFFCAPAPAANPYPETGPALDVYQQFVDHLASRDFSTLYPQLDEMSQAYLGCCLEVIGEIRIKIDANPSHFKPEETDTLRMMFGAKDEQELFAAANGALFSPTARRRAGRLRCVEVIPIHPPCSSCARLMGGNSCW